MNQHVPMLSSGTQVYSPPSDKRICIALEVLGNADLSKAIDVSDIAKAVNLSHSRFRHIFKLEVGETPHGYIRLMKMQRAKALLENSYRRVKEVMVMVGYGDSSHFWRDYKKCFSVAPSNTRCGGRTSL